MRLTRKWGVILLSVWLILAGLNVLIHFGFHGFEVVMAVLAIAAGVLLLLER